MSISAWNFSQTQFRLKGSYLPTSPGYVNETILRKDIDLLISALRLTKTGDVGILWSCDMEEESSTPTNVHSGGVVQPNPVREFGPQYNLSAQDISEVQKNFAKLSELSKSSAVDELAIALRRFNQSYGRRDYEDRIIDLVIALEASLTRGEKTELRYRLALRGAAFLRAIQPPRETKVILQAAYDVRSEIVHEGRHMQHPQIQKILGKLSPQTTASDFSAKCEDIVRKVLREYVNQLGATNRLDTINGSLEDSIVDGLN